MRPNSSCPNTYELRFRENCLLVVDPYALSAPLGPLLPFVDLLGLAHERLREVYRKELTHILSPSTWPKSWADLSEANAELRPASTELWVLWSSTQAPRLELSLLQRRGYLVALGGLRVLWIMAHAARCTKRLSAHFTTLHHEHTRALSSMARIYCRLPFPTLVFL